MIKLKQLLSENSKFLGSVDSLIKQCTIDITATKYRIQELEDEYEKNDSSGMSTYNITTELGKENEKLKKLSDELKKLIDFKSDLIKGVTND